MKFSFWPRRRPAVVPTSAPFVPPSSPSAVPPPVGFAGWSIPWPLLLVWAVLWAVETGHWLAAAFIGLVVGLPAVVQVRWAFSNSWRRRALWSVGILTSVLGTYAWLDKVSGGPVWFVVSWFPALLLPLLIEERWGAPVRSRDVLPRLIKAWPWSPAPTPRPAMSRERWAHWAFQWPHRFSLPVVIYPRALYAGLVWGCVLAGAAGRWQMAAALLSGLWGLKGVSVSNRRPWAEWLAFVVLTVALGTSGVWAMRWTQTWIEETGMRWLFNRHPQNDWFDPSHTETRIGQTGSLDDGESLRFRIVWNQPPNTHLPVAVYDVVTSNGVQWSVSRRLGNTVPLKLVNSVRNLPGANGVPLTSLNNLPPVVQRELSMADQRDPARAPSSEGTITIPVRPPHVFRGTAGEQQALLSGDFAHDDNARLPLPLPTNSHALIGMDTAAMAQNAAGSVLATSTQGALDLRVMYAPDTYLDLKPPSADDRRTPQGMDAALDQALHAAHASGQDTPDQAAQRLTRWFQANYHYTLSLADASGGGRTLTEFLTSDRQGHCEYFATATALMLRRLGVPTRYVTGVLVNEAHPNEDPHMYWVRERHFHAWVVYWNGAGWQTLDTTPADLGAAWAAERPWYTGLANAWLHWQYVLGNLDVSAWENDWAGPALGLVAILVLLLAWFQRHRFQSAGPGWLRRRRAGATTPRLPESERAFEIRLAQVLAEHPRQGEEPWGIWARRVGDPRWQQAVAEHYQHRYGTPNPSQAILNAAQRVENPETF